jgi:HlyD family secretion protein
MSFIKTHKILSFIIAIALLGGGYYIYARNTASAATTRYILGRVRKGQLVLSVSGTGQISATNQLNIKPQVSGTIISLNVRNGQYVQWGQTIATLDQRNSLVTLAQDKASLESAQANYNKVVSGVTNEDIAVSKASVDASQVSLQNAQKTLIDKINSAYVAANDAVSNHTNSYFTNPLSDFAQFTIPGFTISDTQLVSNINAERIAINHALPTWHGEIVSLATTTDPSFISQVYSDSVNNVNSVGVFLDNIVFAFTSRAIGSPNLQSTLAGYQSDSASARSSISSASTNLLTAEQSLLSASSTLQQNQASLALKVQPVSPNDIATAQAQIDTAKAQLQSAEYTYQNNIITAPFSGQVGGITNVVGDQVSSASIIASLVTPQQQAAISLNEIDAEKILVGQKAQLTFDAIPNETITGTVAELDPIGVVSQGVVTYNVKIALDKQDARIKPGMSVSAIIVTSTLDNTLLVPNSAVKTVGNTSSVQVINNLPPSVFSQFSQGGRRGGISSTTASDQIATSTATTTESAGRPGIGGGGRVGNGGGGGTGNGGGPSVLSTQVQPVTQTVQIGLSNNTFTQITAGVNEGDWVVVRSVSGSVATASASTAPRTGTSVLGVPTGGGGGGNRVFGGGRGPGG